MTPISGPWISSRLNIEIRGGIFCCGSGGNASHFERARQRISQKRGGHCVRRGFRIADVASPSRPDEIVALDEALALLAFGTRSPRRPNLVALTLCKIVAVKDNTIEIEKTDAFDGTPVLDMKPFFPGYDSTLDATIPDWLERVRKKCAAAN